jgi:hypothetical protein
MRFGGNFNPEWGYLAPAPSFMRTARIVAVATAIGATAGAAVVLSLADRVGPTPDSAANDAGKTLVVVRSLVQPAEAAVASPPPAPAVVSAPAQTNAQPAAAAAQPYPQLNTPRVALVQPVAEANAPAVATVSPPAPASVQAPSEVQDQRAPAAGDAMAARSPASVTVAPAAADSATEATPAAPGSVAALAESPPAADAAPGPAQAIDDAIAVPEQSAAQKGKKHHGTDRGAAVPAAQANASPGSKKRSVSGGDHGIGPLLRHIFSGGPSYYPR